MPTKVALDKAYDEGLDLVCVAPQAKPPVCKMMDYSRYKYELQKKQREAKKNQKIIETHEYRLSPTIEKNDFDTKLKQARKYLLKGDKVKVSIRFRGRMITHKEIGEAKILEFCEQLSDISTIEQKPTLDQRTMVAMLNSTADKVSK